MTATRLQLSRVAAAFASIAMLWPQAAFAHASERGFVMLLPTQYYVAGGAAAVAASFVLLALAPGEPMQRAFRVWTAASFPLPRAETVTSLLSLAFGIVLVAAGFTGTRDPLTNPLPLTIWTVMWVGLTLATALIGNLWGAINPWSGLMRLIAPARAPFTLPQALGYAPAILGLLAFGWFELVYPAPEDPARLAWAVMLYWAVTFIAMLLFGERDWAERGEFLSIFYRFISSFAPLRFRRDGERVDVLLSLPGAGLASNPPPVSGAVFILCALAVVSFDGLNKTFWWLARIGVNPLEFPGRSAVVSENTIGLLTACSMLTLAFFGCVTLGRWLAANGPLPPTKIGAGEAVACLAFSIIPISLAYHFSHYLTVLLVNGQYALAAASDPLGTGADLLGLGEFYVTTSFLNRSETVETIWNMQSGAIVLGHVIAICVAHRIALGLWPGGAAKQNARKAALSQLPLAILMVLYTVFGLWLLASPTGA